MSEPAITTAAEGNDRLDATLVVNGAIDLRKTHPNLFWLVLTLGVMQVALGVNFLVFTPTFLIYGLPNEVWSACFLAIGGSKIVFLCFVRRLKYVRLAMALAIGYLLFLGIGTGQPAWEGKGSLQLPLFYLSVALLQIPLLLEPFINPWTARRE